MPYLPLTDRIDAVLPQTQCAKCGYDGCRPYAEAIASGEATINRCPPGGQEGVRALAAIVGTTEIPLDAARGQHIPLQVAVIDEAHCIGCTLCIQACPVDAIIGANKLMHTVLPELCTGCDLCVASCPVDCITMVEAGRQWTPMLADAARDQFHRRLRRLGLRHGEASGLAARTLANKAPLSAAAESSTTTRQNVIANALARARARREAK
ncbi:MAG TPA: electron transport complex subunit RsxB [Candidimonas sp.]|nr:electron transport complex subunit RsxB [Candidimonas sp.]